MLRTSLAEAERLGEELDLLISDVVMPEMNGRELADLVQERCADARA